jgi:UDP-N-acetylmuramoyl-tripeptide--D-alanyl-D-alanine ligase
MTIQEIYSLFKKCSSVSIDTRKINTNSLFVALKGANFDANTFAEEALKKGAAYVVIDNPKYYINEKTILVEDSLKCLQELARFHRNAVNITIIALTGSNGKTTTKELINVVLDKKNKFGSGIAKSTIGNLNNHIGVPLTLLSFDEKVKIGIVEMGANHQKEIEFLCSIAQPDYGYITNYGKAHLEGFGGVEGVIKGKSEMYDYLRNNNKTAFVNLNDPIQLDKSKEINRVGFAMNDASAFLSIDGFEANPFVKISFEGIVIQSRLIGSYNTNNIIAAITMGKYFGVSNENIKDAIESYVPDNNRSQLITKNGNEIILDAYNANPSSMKVAIENFIGLDKKGKIIFLGDMFELGDESRAEHTEIVKLLENEASIETYFIGNNFYNSKNSVKHFSFFDSYENFEKSFHKKVSKSIILIKGSRGMALERIIELI